MTGSAPLIVTAQLPTDLAHWLTALRSDNYPPERNFLPAHVTLFHALPPSAFAEARELLAALAREFAPVAASLARVISLGSGTAFLIESPGLLELRDYIAERFHGALSAQDTGRPRLHVTVQNKVTPNAARLLRAKLDTRFKPRGFTFTGLAMHHYRGGPWEPAGAWAFRGKQVVDRPLSAP